MERREDEYLTKTFHLTWQETSPQQYEIHKIRQINYFQSEGSHKIYSLEMEKHQNKSSFTKK